MKEVIEGKRVILRRMKEEDTAAAVRWRNASCVREQYIFKDTVTEEMHRKWFRERVMSGEVEQFVIVIKDSGEEIGSQFFKDIDKSTGRAEYGIYIGMEEQLGKGYGTEVMELALEYAAVEMGLKEVILKVLAGNERALAIYRSHGFVEYKREVPGDAKLPEIIYMKRMMGCLR